MSEYIKEYPIDNLRPWEGNPRKHTDDVDMLVVSIRAHGFKDPIEIDKDGTILAGHGRREAALKIGLDKVPVIKHDCSIRDKKVQAYVLANNKTAERSEWDYPKLKDVFTEIDTGEFQLEVTGFDMGEIEDILTYSRVEEIEPPDLASGEKEPYRQITFNVHEEQAEEVFSAIKLVKSKGLAVSNLNENSNGNALYVLAKEYNG